MNKTVDELCSQAVAQVRFYGGGSAELEGVITDNPRLVSANLAACMLDKERFSRYWNKSLFWRIKLDTALRFMATSLEARGSDYGPESNAFLNSVRDLILFDHTGKFIWQNYKTFDYKLDPQNVEIMLLQLLQ